MSPKAFLLGVAVDVPLHLWFIFCKGALLLLKVCVCYFRVLEERKQGT